MTVAVAEAQVDSTSAGNEVQLAQGENAEPFDKAQSKINREDVSEIIVTARKQSERLEDVPMAISVLDAGAMVQRNELYLQDYYASIPGVSITDYGQGGRVAITMRGLSTGNLGNPTVGITIDDVPIGATNTALIYGNVFVPQLDPADLQRVEFLKGPQGTLYGASSLTGVVRYVTSPPDLTSTNGHVDVDGSVIPGGGLGYGVRGSVNIPLIADTLAIRVGAFDRRDPGFVDDPSHGRDNVNSIDNYGFHAAGLLQATQDFSIRVNAMIQRTTGNGDSTIDTNYLFQPTLGDLNQSRLPGTGYHLEYQLYSAALNFHSALFEVTSITAYGINRDNESIDGSAGFFGSFANFLYGVNGAATLNSINSEKFSQEIRISSPVGSKLEWQVGGFYTNENNGPSNQTFTANDLATGAVVGPIGDFFYPSSYREYAGFGDLDYHFTDRFDVQLGAREGHNKQSFFEDFSGPLAGPIPTIFTAPSSDNSFTYLASPKFRISDEVMAYARVASGYQVGGPNSPIAASVSPPAFGPSKTVNYELGLKSRLLDHRLSIDADIFYVNWSKIQLSGLTPSGFTYIFNGGKAKSQGLEIAMEFRPVEDFTLTGTAAYTDATLTNNAGNGFPGVAGDPLPFSSKYSGSLSADKKFGISSSVSGFVGATAAYVGKRYEGFPADVSQPQPSVPSYTYVNARSGILTSGYTVTAFVRNITNKRGVLSSVQQSGSTPTEGTWYTSFITPRTVGVSLSKAF